MHHFFTRVQLHQQKRLLSRYTFNKTPEQVKDLIKKLVKVEKVNDSQIDSYFLDYNLSYHPFKLKPMFQDIGEFEYFKPIERLASNFSEKETNYYKQILQNVQNIQNMQNMQNIQAKEENKIQKERLNKLNYNIDIEDIYYIMLQYICSLSTFHYNNMAYSI